MAISARLELGAGCFPLRALHLRTYERHAQPPALSRTRSLSTRSHGTLICSGGQNCGPSAIAALLCAKKVLGTYHSPSSLRHGQCRPFRTCVDTPPARCACSCCAAFAFCARPQKGRAIIVVAGCTLGPHGPIIVPLTSTVSCHHRTFIDTKNRRNSRVIAAVVLPVQDRGHCSALCHLSRR